MPGGFALLGLSVCLLEPATHCERQLEVRVVPNVWERAESSLVPLAPAPRSRRTQRQPDSLLNGALVGGVIGGGYGTAVWVYARKDLEAGAWTMIPTSIAIGSAAGVLVDWLRR